MRCTAIWCTGFLLTQEKAHRESPRINANRIFLAFGDSAPAYRLRRNRPLTGKMLGKNPRAGFSIVLNLSFLIWGAGPRLRRGGGNL
jgi:hypothetical protein